MSIGSSCMIKAYTNNTLSTDNIKSEYFLFCQVWKELTEGKTFDSYQFKSFNVVNGLSELLHNLNNYLDNLVPTPHLISSVIEELIKVVRRDYVMNNKFISIKNQLLSCLGKRNDTVAKYKALRYQISLFENELKNSYDNELISCLIDAINNNKQKVVVSLTSIFISRCVDNGWSAKALYSKLDLSDGKEISAFINRIYSYPSQTYVLMFPFRLKIILSGRTREQSKEYLKEQLQKYQILLLSKEEITEDYPQIDETALRNDEYMVLQSTAKDINSASHSGIVKLSNALNVLSFFSAIEPWSINNTSWIAFNADSPYTKSLSPSDIYKTYEYLDSSSTVHFRVEQIITSTSSNDELHQKLRSAFSYTNLSHSSMTVEEKYMNMWIALESLTRTDAYETIIGNILQCIPKACCLRYLYRDVRNFLEDCGRCEISLNFGEINIDIKNSDKEKNVADILRVMRQEDLSNILEQRCRICDLLHFRFLEISEIVKNEQSVISHIRSHYKTVEWHLNRLYRIRNEIAHSALSQNAYVVRYTEHLYDYLATYISEIVRFATNDDNMLFGEIVSAINFNYDEFEYIASEKHLTDKKTFLKRLWTSGVMEYI